MRPKHTKVWARQRHKSRAQDTGTSQRHKTNAQDKRTGQKAQDKEQRQMNKDKDTSQRHTTNGQGQMDKDKRTVIQIIGRWRKWNKRSLLVYWQWFLLSSLRLWKSTRTKVLPPVVLCNCSGLLLVEPCRTDLELCKSTRTDENSGLKLKSFWGPLTWMKLVWRYLNRERVFGYTDRWEWRWSEDHWTEKQRGRQSAHLHCWGGSSHLCWQPANCEGFFTTIHPPFPVASHWSGLSEQPAVQWATYCGLACTLCKYVRCLESNMDDHFFSHFIYPQGKTPFDHPIFSGYLPTLGVYNKPRHQWWPSLITQRDSKTLLLYSTLSSTHSTWYLAGV